MATTPAMQAILNARPADPSGMGQLLGQGLTKGLSVRSQRQAEEEERRRKDTLMNIASTAYGGLQLEDTELIPYLGQQETKLRNKGFIELADELKNMQMMDIPTIQAELKGDLFGAGGQLGLPASVLGGRTSASKAFAPETVRRQTGTDEKGEPVYQYYQQGVTYDPNTGQASTYEVEVDQPLTSTGETITEKRAAETTQKGEQIKLQEGIKAEIEQQKQAALQASKVKAAQEAQELAAAKTYEDILPALDRLESYVKQGIYTGNLLDKSTQWASKIGIVTDQEKLDRTTRARQIATNLKFMAKPAGMGTMTDAEWKIIQEAIPDPDSSTEGQLIAGIDEFKRTLKDRAGSLAPTLDSGMSEKQARLQALRAKQ